MISSIVTFFLGVFLGYSGSFAEVFDGKDTGSDSAELLEEFSCVSGRATGMGSGSGTIEDWQLVSLVGEFPEKGLVSPADGVDNSRMSASIVESLVESETCAA